MSVGDAVHLRVCGLLRGQYVPRSGWERSELRVSRGFGMQPCEGRGEAREAYYCTSTERRPESFVRMRLKPKGDAGQA